MLGIDQHSNNMVSGCPMVIYIEREREKFFFYFFLPKDALVEGG